MKTHYSCAELAAMKLPGYPTTKKGWYALVERESFLYQGEGAIRTQTGVGSGHEVEGSEEMNYRHIPSARDLAWANSSGSRSSEINQIAASHFGQRSMSSWSPFLLCRCMGASQAGHLGTPFLFQFTPKAYNRLRVRHHNTRKTRHDGSNTRVVNNHSCINRGFDNHGNSLSAARPPIPMAVLPARPANSDMADIPVFRARSLVSSLADVITSLCAWGNTQFNAGMAYRQFTKAQA